MRVTPRKLSAAERRAYFFITLPNVYVDGNERRFYKDHVTVHDVGCRHARKGTQGTEIMLGHLLQGPEYLMRRFGLACEPPVRWCKQCLKHNPYEAMMPKPDLLRTLEEDEFLGSIQPSPEMLAFRQSRQRSS